MGDAPILSSPIHRDPDIMGGTPVFIGTRVPARTVFDYLSDGCTLDEFLENFPSVSRQDAVKVLETGKASLLEPAQAS